MPFYYLHDEKIEPKSEKDFKYLYYNANALPNYKTTIKFEGEDVIYCPHELTGKFLQWSVDDSNIDILRHEKTIIATFKKVANHDSFELWKNIEFD